MIFSEASYSESPFSATAFKGGWNGELFLFDLKLKFVYGFDLRLIY